MVVVLFGTSRGVHLSRLEFFGSAERLVDNFF